MSYICNICLALALTVFLTLPGETACRDGAPGSKTWKYWKTCTEALQRTTLEQMATIISLENRLRLSESEVLLLREEVDGLKVELERYRK